MQLHALVLIVKEMAYTTDSTDPCPALPHIPVTFTDIKMLYYSVSPMKLDTMCWTTLGLPTKQHLNRKATVTYST